MASQQRLLEGVRILDLTHMLAGPYGTMLLADLGAEVIKVEPPGGDPMRGMGPHFVDGQSLYFVSINRSKGSIGIDLKTEEGRGLLLELAGTADVVVENLRAGALEQLGLGYGALREANPRIVLCRLSGFGQTGPDRDLPAFDLAVQAWTGAMSITGYPDHPPARMGIPMGDLAGGMFVALSIAAALVRRERTGEGASIDLALTDTLLSPMTYVAQFLLGAGEVPGPMGSSHSSVVPYRVFQAGDGAWIVVAAFAENFWRRLCECLERPDLRDDVRFGEMEARRRNAGELYPLLEAVFRERPAAEWLERLRAAGVPCSPVNRLDQALAEPQVRAREMVVQVGTSEMLGNPVKVEGVRDRFAPPPVLGASTAALLDELGYDAAGIAELRERGIIR